MEERIIPFTNSDQSKNAVTIFDPGMDNASPMIILFPAMGMKAEYYRPLAEAFARSGICTATADLRGKGRSDVRPSKKVDFGYHEMIEMDMDGAMKSVRSAFPGRRVFLLGHSLGGQLGCLYAAKYPSNVDGLVLIGCCSLYYKGWDGFSKYRILMGTQFAGLLSTAMGYFPGRRVGFGGTNAKTTMQDWSRQCRTGKYTVKNDDFNFEEALAKTGLPILTISFEGDNFCPKTAVDQLVAKFSAASEIQQIHLGKADPLNERFNHFNWAKKPNSIVRLTEQWLEGNTN